jgi:hypothetical protein
MFCELADVKKYVHYQYLEKLDEIRPGAVDIHIGQVNGEVSEAVLQGGFALPAVNTSATLRRIAGVMSAWYCVCAITSVMDTEAGSNNEWIPLQKNYERAMKDLDSIREGLLNPFPEDISETASGGGVSVVVPLQMFDSEFWERF